MATLSQKVLATALLLSSTFLMVSSNGFKAQAEVANDMRAWPAITLTVPITKKVYYTSYNGDIIRDNLQTNQLVIWHNFFGYKLTPHVNLELGYSYLLHTPAVGKANTENRIMQQVVTNHKVKDFSFLNRVRLEERFFTWKNQMLPRLRWYTQVSHPICFTDSCEKKNYGYLGNEFQLNFGNFSTYGMKTGLEQNRVRVGLGRHVTSWMDAETGYMLWFFNRHNGIPNALAHVLEFNLRFNVGKLLGRPNGFSGNAPKETAVSTSNNQTGPLKDTEVVAYATPAETPAALFSIPPLTSPETTPETTATTTATTEALEPTDTTLTPVALNEVITP